MKKRAIKVIKRVDVARKPPLAAKVVKSSTNTNQKIVNAVNGWIFELRENRNKERVFSDKVLSREFRPEPV